MRDAPGDRGGSELPRVGAGARDAHRSTGAKRPRARGQSVGARSAPTSKEEATS
jgi:hypothetical protein